MSRPSFQSVVYCYRLPEKWFLLVAVGYIVDDHCFICIFNIY